MLIFGFAASIIISLCYMPQCIKIYKTKDTLCLSWKTFGLVWLGMILFTIHGFIIGDIPLIISSLASFAQNSYILYMIIKSK